MSDTIVMHTNSGSASKQETNMNVKELQKWLNTGELPIDAPLDFTKQQLKDMWIESKEVQL